MVDIEEEIKQLEKVIDESFVIIVQIDKEINILKNKSLIDQATIIKQEKELKTQENKLLTC